MSKIINADKLISKMEERENDKSAHSPNSVDIGYTLAVNHMKEEIDLMDDELTLIKNAMNEIKSKKQMHEYGGFEIDRISIDEVLSIITKHTGIEVE